MTLHGHGASLVPGVGLCPPKVHYTDQGNGDSCSPQGELPGQRQEPPFPVPLTQEGLSEVSCRGGNSFIADNGIASRLNLRIELAATAIGLLLVLTFFLIPFVPYSVSVGIPNDVRAGRMVKFDECSNSTSGTVSGSVGVTTNSSATIQYLCLVPYPPVSIQGYSTLSYRLLGAGSPPFPSQMEITQGNASALVFFQGDRAVAAEDIGPAGTLVDPPELAVVRSSFIPVGSGYQNYTVVIRNNGQSAIYYPTIAIQVKGYGFNDSVDGLLWMDNVAIGSCGPLQEGLIFAPGTECRISELMQIPTNVTLTYYVEVTAAEVGHHIFCRQGFSQFIPAEGITTAWVGEFIKDLNNARGPMPLLENSTLDRFAAMRFMTASSQPDISDYGFANDLKAFFPSGGPPYVAETLLFPGGFTPSNFTAFLKNSAPGHWAALTDGTYEQFGYYVGQARYFDISLNCPTREIPSGGVNITQYFESHGCAVTPVNNAYWLVIILAS